MIAVVPAPLGMWLLCPLAGAQLGETSRPADSDREWLFVDKRALVEVREAR